MALALAVCGASAASANATYQYAGQNFDRFFTGSSYTVAMSVTGYVELLDPLAANLTSHDLAPRLVSFSFYDGLQTFSDALTYQGTEFLVSTDGSGQIVEWAITVTPEAGQVPGAGLEICNLGSIGPGNGCVIAKEEDAGYVGNVALTSGPGVWTLVPEPSSGLLLASGVVSLASAWRRRA